MNTKWLNAIKIIKNKRKLKCLSFNKHKVPYYNKNKCVNKNNSFSLSRYDYSLNHVYNYSYTLLLLY